MTVHRLAYVAEGAEIDPGVEIEAFAFIGPRVRIQEGCRILSHAVIRGNTRIGRETIIHPHTVVGGAPQDRKYKGGPTRLVIGERNSIREGVTINTGTEVAGGMTRIGDDNVLMANSHVAHDCVLGDRIVLANNVMLAGHVRVHDGAILNGGAGAHHFTTVGTLAYVGGLSRIGRDAPPYLIIEGYPARVRGVNVIGLKRAGMSDEVVRAVKDAYKLVYRSDQPTREAVARLKVEFAGCAEVQLLASFLEASDAGRHGRQGEELGRELDT